ncbi:MAG TPA: MarR family transcriptional regulator [Candidatus Nanoperiomorbaceae bacterium]|nr:MarR family transcriptional regulator [Candidatus Nanoperiomorbaceae bacterium]HMQ96708.1 MarR family transcriptional regulator [Candidatus Nanoperiomorbaceae bacterium]HMR85974.1 MarR family transcriptional regulator [Candidatus Nanoperiomorbaceae bacterium]HMU11962.1 MarR family transcriptional regulator [Candidatus Nanoperiomorbaceae bacterium]
MNREQHIEAIFKNFHAIKRAYSHGSRFSHRHFGVTMTQASVLMLLMHEGRKTMGELALALGVSKSAVTQLLNSLIEQGFIERNQDEQDRRVAYVELSRDGVRHLRRVRRGGARQITQLFDLLTDEELQQIETITAKLVNRAKEIRK